MKYFLITISFLIHTSIALASTYNLEIKKQDVFITGKAVEAITINGQIPGPTLNFTEGEDVEINVKNSMDEPTSLHWHGILLPAKMDGVPGLNGFEGIKPNQTFTYKFKIRQAGTYWYHSHSNAQEQRGLYGSIVITANKLDPKPAQRDYVIILSDFTEENPNTILNNLKLDSGYYNQHKRTVATFFSDAKKDGFFVALKDYMNWSQMRMDPTDLADVGKYHFLINGKSNDSPPSPHNYFLFKKGEKIKLRFINASAMTIFDVSIPGFTPPRENEFLRSEAQQNDESSYLKMKFVEADGQPIKGTSKNSFFLYQFS